MVENSQKTYVSLVSKNISRQKKIILEISAKVFPH